MIAARLKNSTVFLVRFRITSLVSWVEDNSCWSILVQVFLESQLQEMEFNEF